MNTLLKRSRRFGASALLALASVVVMICACLGCAGGGTEGTGVRSFEGTVIDDTTGLPLAGVEITVLETGDSTLSNSDGTFALDVNDEASELTFELRTASSSAATTVSDLPGTDQLVQLSARLNRQTNVADINVVGSRPVPTPTVNSPHPTSTPNGAQPPTPAPTVAPTATAHQSTPQPTATPNDQSGGDDSASDPTATPTSEATATSTPTVTPTPFVPTEADVDLNGDGMINVNDAVLATNLYAAGTFDFNHDGVTNAKDLQDYIDAFNQFAE